MTTTTTTTTTKNPIYREQIETDIQRHTYHDVYFNLEDVSADSIIGALWYGDNGYKGCCGYILCPDNCAHVYIDTTEYLSNDPLKGLLEYQFADLLDSLLDECDGDDHKYMCGTRDYDTFIYQVSRMLDRNDKH